MAVMGFEKKEWKAAKKIAKKAKRLTTREIEIMSSEAIGDDGFFLVVKAIENTCKCRYLMK